MYNFTISLYTTNGSVRTGIVGTIQLLQYIWTRYQRDQPLVLFTSVFLGPQLFGSSLFILFNIFSILADIFLVSVYIRYMNLNSHTISVCWSISFKIYRLMVLKQGSGANRQYILKDMDPQN